MTTPLDIGLPPDWQIARVLSPLSETVDWSHAFLKLTPDWYKADCSLIKVGVLDTGCAMHPDLQHIEDRVDFTNSASGPFDVLGHGTWCCGCIAADTNDIGVRGIASGCRLWSIKVLGDNGSGSDRTVALGIKYAIDKNLDVLNLSLGGSSMSMEVNELIRTFLKSGKAVVCAAGNDGKGSRVNYPARWPECTAIAAVDGQGKLTSFSSYEPDIVTACAPGWQLLSTIPGGYGLMSGTSMASPIAAGIIAKIIAKHRNWGGDSPINTVEQLEEHIRRLATVQNDLYIINPMAMLAFELPPPPPPPPAPPPPLELVMPFGTWGGFKHGWYRQKVVA